MSNNKNKVQVLLFTAKDFYNKKQHLGKVFSFDGSHVVQKRPSTPANGTIQKLELSIQELQKLLSNFPQNSALVSGQVLDDKLYTQNDGLIYVNCAARDKANVLPQTISRTKDYINFNITPSLLLIDYDPEVNTDALTPEQLHTEICKVHSGFTGAGYVVKHSSSAGIIKPDGKPYKEINGFHMYYFVKNGSSIPYFIKELYSACWLNGYGFIKVSKNGNKLDRVTLFDKYATDSARLVFEANPILNDNLTRKVTPVEVVKGNWLDTSSINIDHEIAKIEIAKAKGSLHVVKEANKNKEVYSNHLSTKYGKDKAKEILDNQESGILFSDRCGLLKGNLSHELRAKGCRIGDEISLESCAKISNGKVTFEDFINDRADKDLDFYPNTMTIRTYAHGGASFDVLTPMAEGSKWEDIFPSQKMAIATKKIQKHIEPELVIDALPIRSALMACIPYLMSFSDIKKCIFAVNHSYRGNANGLLLLKEWLNGTQFEHSLIFWWKTADKKLPQKPIKFGTLKHIAKEFGWIDGENLGPHRVIDDIAKWLFCDLAKVSVRNFSSYSSALILKGDFGPDKQDSLAHAAAFKFVKHCFEGNVNSKDMATHINHCLPEAKLSNITRYFEFAEYRQRAGAKRLVTFGNIAKTLGCKTIKSFGEIEFDTEKKQRIFLRAPMGSGKTEYCAESIAGTMVAKGYKVVIITHRERLSRRNAISYSPHGADYSDDEVEMRILDYKSPVTRAFLQNDLTKIQGVSICVNSIVLHKWPKWLKTADCIIIDEASQVLDHMANTKIMGALQAQTWCAFIELLNKANTVMLMDAGLSDADLELLVKEANTDEDLQSLAPLSNVKIYDMPINALPEDRQYKPLHVLPDESLVLNKIKNCCGQIVSGDEKGHFIFACDSVTLPWVVRDLAIDKGISPERILIITGKSNKTAHLDKKQAPKSVEDFIADPDGQSYKYDIIAYSPAIDSGLSLKKNPPQFHNLFAVFQGVASASSCLQQLKRLRTVNSVTVFLDPGRTVKGDTDEQTMLSKANAAGLTPSETKWFDAFKICRGERVAEMVSNQGATIAAIAESLGFKIVQAIPSSECLQYLVQNSCSAEFDELMNSCKTFKQNITSDHINAVINAKPLPRDFIRELCRSDISPDQRLSTCRYYITETLGIPFDDPLTSDDAEFALKDKNRIAILNFELLTGYREAELKDKDLLRPLSLQRHEAHRVKLAKYIFETAQKGLTETDYFLHGDLLWVINLFEHLWDNKDELIRFGLVPSNWSRKGLNKPTDIVKTVKSSLKQIGYSFRRRRANSGELSRIYVCKSQIKNDSLSAKSYNSIAESESETINIHRLDQEAFNTLNGICKRRLDIRNQLQTEKLDKLKMLNISTSKLKELPAEWATSERIDIAARKSNVGLGSENVGINDISLPTDNMFTAIFKR
jgi:hypothetical protein